MQGWERTASRTALRPGLSPVGWHQSAHCPPVRMLLYNLGLTCLHYLLGAV
jgi:hypothetical protein